MQNVRVIKFLFATNLLLFSAVLNAQTLNEAEQLDALEERLIQAEKQSRRDYARIRSVKRDLNAKDQKLKINGFAQVGVAATGNTDNDDYGLDVQSNRTAIYNDPSFEGQTLFAVQASLTVSEKAEAVTQIVARGSEDFRAEMAWAYLRYHLNDNLTVRVGRLRTPFFALSEYLEVGYAQPWARPPIEVYGNNISNYNGIDFEYKKRIGEVSSSFRLYTGSKDSVVAGYQVKLNNILGGRFELLYRNFNFFVGYGEADIKVTPAGQPDPIFEANNLAAGINEAALGITLTPFEDNSVSRNNAKGSFGSLGLGYDNGVWNLSTELRSQTIDGILQDDQAHYISIARRFGDWTPYIIYSRYYTDDDYERDNANLKLDQWKGQLQSIVPTLQTNASSDPVAAATLRSVGQALEGIETIRHGANTTGEQTSYGLGVRWDFIRNMALKFEYLQVRDNENSPNISTRNGALEEGEELDAYTLVFNAVF